MAGVQRGRALGVAGEPGTPYRAGEPGTPYRAGEPGTPYRAGDLLLAELGPGAGHEQGGRRPALVLSGPSYNELRNRQIIIAAVTSTERGLPFHVPVGTGTGLRGPSWVQCETVRAISADRVVRLLGRVPPETLAEVRRRVANFLRDW
jgi:mRNA interferase MazF